MQKIAQLGAEDLKMKVFKYFEKIRMTISE